MKFDSTQETEAHIKRVVDLLTDCLDNIARRQDAHDVSKLLSPEKECFDEVTGTLKALTYGSDEYRAALARLKPALDHHYAHNSHHPEHYPSGVNGMSLLDLIEMLCDWKAAGERHADGSMERSLRLNRERFKISDQLQDVLINTAAELGWIDEGQSRNLSTDAPSGHATGVSLPKSAAASAQKAGQTE
jgi:hypothetical protein